MGRLQRVHMRRQRPSSRSQRPRNNCRLCCRASGAAPRLISDINISLDDKFLYIACWGTGEMRQYDVTEPKNPL
jgi:selenium-binding protein 1